MTVAVESNLIKRIESLPPLPMIAQKIESLTTSPNVSATQVGKALRQDPAIASRVLRVANSPFYGAAQKVTQISRAVVILGGRAVRNVVLGLCAKNSLVPSKNQDPEHVALWAHSVAAAVVCEQIARQCGVGAPEEAFLAGLLHDSGRLAMVGCDPDFVKVLLSRRLSEAQNLEAEREHFGLDHAEAGHQILAKWGLPDSFCQVAGRHHDAAIEVQGEADRMLACAMIATDVVQVIGYGSDIPAGSLHRLRTAAMALGLGADVLAALLVDLDDRITDTISLFGGVETQQASAPPPESFSRIHWVSDAEDAYGVNICEAYLVGRGSFVRRATPSDMCADVQTEDVFFIDVESVGSDDAVAMASRLVSEGYRHVVVLSDGQNDRVVQLRNVEHDICVIPRLFTVYDLQWLEQQWKR